LNPLASPNRSADEFELAELQSLLYRLVTAPAGVEEALSHERSLQDFELETVIAGNKRLSARDRVGIYANAYFYRLLDIFKEDFFLHIHGLGRYQLPQSDHCLFD
jgi:hypothetical protein